MKVVAFGDSLTQGNAICGEFLNWTDLVAEELGIEVVNAGVGGNTTSMARDRLQNDVLEYKPDIVLINFGMNDHLLKDNGKNQVDVETFRNNLCYFIDEIVKQGGEPVLMTPNSFIEGDDRQYYYSRHDKSAHELYGGALKLLDIYISEIRSISKEKNIALIDVRTECERYDLFQFLRTMENCNANDGVHPAKLGVRVYANMVEEFIKKRMT